VERGGVIYHRTLFGKSVLAHTFVEKTIKKKSVQINLQDSKSGLFVSLDTNSD